MPRNELLLASGQRCYGISRHTGPLDLLTRQLLEFSWYSEHCSLEWKPKETNASRLYFQLTPSIPEGETSYGLWRTPSAQEPGIDLNKLQCKDGSPPRVGERLYDKETGRLAQIGLPQQVLMMPKLWHTPRANDCGESSNTFVKRNADRGEHCFSGLTAQARKFSNTDKGILNPTWVEWLMGFPEGWTDC